MQAGRLQYDHIAIDAKAATAAVVERFADPSWLVRAHLAESLRWVVLDGDLAQAASGLINDPHWLVRMLAMRCFADHHGEKFDKVIVHYADSDSDALVRRVCHALRQRWATSRPASRPAK